MKKNWAKSRIFIATALTALCFCACEDSDTLNVELVAPAPATKAIWIDSACGDFAASQVINAAERLNDFAGAELVEIVGWIDVDHSDPHPADDVVACFYDEIPSLCGPAGCHIAGSTKDSSIDLYLFADGFRFRTVLHELIHYVGVDGHPDDCRGITYQGGGTDFEACDADYFCRFFNCAE